MISRESLCGSEKFIFQNPLRIPHAAVSSSLVSGKCGYLRQSRNIPITMQNCAIIQVLSFVRYCVRCAWFCDFCSGEIVSVLLHATQARYALLMHCISLGLPSCRGAICARSLANKLADSLRLIIKSFGILSSALPTNFQDRLVVTASHTPRSHRRACSPVTSVGILVFDEIFHYSLFGL